MMSSRTTSANRRPGIVAPMVAILLVPLLGIAVLVLDGGLLLADRARTQAAADAAALAAAIDLYQNYSTNQGKDPKGNAATSAKKTAQDNGFTDGTGGVVVTVNIPPRSGTFSGLDGYAEVIITMQEQQFFSRIWGSNTLNVKARAVARGAQAPKNNGIIVLDPSGSNTLQTSNTANITVSNGNIVVDSTDSKAGSISNSGNIQAPELDFTGSPGYFSSGSGSFIGTKLSNQPATPDPLLHLNGPDQPILTYNNVNISGLPSLGGNVPGFPTLGDSNGWTLPPGTYDGGIHISDNNSSHTYTLESGTYYFTNGGLSLSSNANIQSGSGGVLLYFHDGGALSITAGGSVTLSPMTTGTYANITVYQDRSNNSQDSVTGQSTGNFNVTGTVYTPKAKFTLTGSGGNYAIGSQYIVNQLVVTGSGSFNVVYNGTSAYPNRYLYLAE